MPSLLASYVSDSVCVCVCLCLCWCVHMRVGIRSQALPGSAQVSPAVVEALATPASSLIDTRTDIFI